MKTIVAISTPLGSGGISIIRMSGSNSFSIAKKMILKIKDKSDVFEFRKMYLCKIKSENFCDIGLVVFFKGPDSFTGEDIVEFHVHGGVYLAQEIKKQCLRLGAELAQPGEFSKRAFINGKLSLEECEGVIDLINSESDKQAQAAFSLASGDFHKMIINIQNELRNVLAQIDVSLDYPDENLEVDTTKEIKDRLKNVKNQIVDEIESYSKGKIIKHGITCAIVGLPNAGKSSLLNALIKEDRAIVSSIAGTTRDVIKESFLINGIKVNLVDTAGINDTNNEIEKIGVQRAIKEANDADVVLYLFDGSKKLSEDDKNLIKSLNNKNIILVKNKQDISINEKIKEEFPTVEISAKNNFGIDELKDKIFNMFAFKDNKNNSIIITNERHIEALIKANENLDESLKLSSNFQSLDLISCYVQNAYNCLGQITGEVGSDKVIDEIFSKFCLGK